MNTLQDTISTLLPDAQKLVKTLLPASREIFRKEGEVPPCAFYVDLEGKVSIVDVLDMSDENKPAIWHMVRNLRENNPIVVFISEVWMAHEKPENINPNGTVKVMPRNRPDRQEAVLLTLWQGERHLCLQCAIKRKPDRMEDWEVMFDSQFPTGKVDRLEGEMNKGGHYPLKAN